MSQLPHTATAQRKQLLNMGFICRDKQGRAEERKSEGERFPALGVAVVQRTVVYTNIAYESPQISAGVEREREKMGGRRRKSQGKIAESRERGGKRWECKNKRRDIQSRDKERGSRQSRERDGNERQRGPVR